MVVWLHSRNVISTTCRYDSVALNDAVHQYPFPSSRYQRVFNHKAEELGFDFRWQQDKCDFNSIEPGELRLGESTPSSFAPSLKADLQRVLEAVEKERLQLVDQSAGLHQHIPFRAPLERYRDDRSARPGRHSDAG